MKNISDTEAYTLFDHVFSKTVRSLSAVVGLKRITQPFWNRWLASGVEPEVIFEFLDEVGTIDNWAGTAQAVVGRKEQQFLARRDQLEPAALVAELRQLSYLFHMAQWGCLPLNDQRRGLYRKARDYYFEAETLAFGAAFKRIGIAWAGQVTYANLHRQSHKAPLVILVHGIDGCKEEHLATELALHAAGFSTLVCDGPGQGEALMLDGIAWTADFPRFLNAAIDAAANEDGVDGSRVGFLGISIGGMWCIDAASGDPRVRAIFDLGAPLHTRKFPKLPFLIKTRLCQVTGARTDADVAAVLGQNNIEDPALLGRMTAHVRILHGERDRVVDTADKQWLLERLLEAGHPREASLRIIPGGDHCCTGHFDTVRDDAVDFFTRTLQPGR
ncbi:alpha/beta fold hydrolase [Novosphingobium sp.]|uniref:alpha/beta hydrolase n=1 Tax=Novosphingobium sp. TaxID=1874826 RepID=UPI0025EF797C|nr:alpha/beta fold hydrolase [Novosphingobium sp.]MCC6926833.1 hypothetical protein [Novosphingobium sp.]